MIKSTKTTTSTLRRSKAVDRARTSSATGPNEVAEGSFPGACPSNGAISADELNDLNSKLAPATQRAAHFDALWSAWSKDGDYVAATATGLAAAACRAAVKKIHTAWFAMRQATLEMEGVDDPIVSRGSFAYVRSGETLAQALDRLIAEIEEADTRTLGSVSRTARILGDRSVSERARRIRACPEWSNPKGILYNHPPDACVLLFKDILVWPTVYEEQKGNLSKITIYRRQAIAFREKVEAHEKNLRQGANAMDATADQRPTLSGLTHAEREQFHDLLDAICAGDNRKRHERKHSERVATVRMIAEHFRSFLNLTRTVATRRFGVEPWSTGIAELTHAALYRHVTSEDVRGALKNWASD